MEQKGKPRTPAFSGDLYKSDGATEAAQRNRIDFQQGGVTKLTVYTHSDTGGLGAYAVDDLPQGVYTMLINGTGQGTITPGGSATLTVGPGMCPTQNIQSSATDVRQVYGQVHHAVGGGGWAGQSNKVEFHTGSLNGTPVYAVYTTDDGDGFYVISLPSGTNYYVVVDGNTADTVTDSNSANLNPLTVTGSAQKLNIYASACDTVQYNTPPSPDD